MNILLATSFALLFVIAPFFLRKWGTQLKITQVFSDVLICFGIGILLGNTQQWWLPNTEHQQTAFATAETSTALSVLFAIPMLMMTSDIRACIRYAPKFLISFVLGIIAVLTATVIAVYMFPDLEELAKSAGCLVGVYVGGTPNMVAISYALKAPNELFVILNSTDLFCSGLYFLFLTAFAKPFFGLFLNATPPPQNTELNAANTLDNTPFPPPALDKQHLKPLAIAAGLALLCIGLSVGLGLLFTTAEGKLNEMLLMVSLTTISIVFSFNSKIQSLKGIYEFAQYLLLIFAIAVGFMADFSKLASTGTTYLAFNIVFVLSLLSIHLLLAKLFKIDNDTFIITSTACVFGPPFIGQVCSAIKNKDMLAPGMALGVIGLIIGTYLGILVSNIIEQSLL